ncbi:MAG: asparagine synthase (glutamine-hydrolyzing), partial [Burkholderiales bacterium]
MLRAMTRILQHRGPDSDGFHFAPGVGLGFRRLAIVDLKTGEQPLANEDGGVIVVCNGEIYNHVELRRVLEAAGHRFRSASDVEVIVHLYEEHGLDFVRHLRGMFGLALWDSRKRQLVLARDRLGIKPLHYAITPEGLFFGSEQKAILAAGAVEPQPDLHALRQLFSYGRVIWPRTMVSGICRLPAGHCLVWSEGQAKLHCYWDVQFPSHDDYDLRIPEQEWAEALRDKLTESVRLHLRSDVPVGAFLSAGIDSSAVTALMSRMVPGRVQTFTLRFEEAEVDELRLQKALDDYPEYRLAGHRILCRASDLERLPAAVWHGEDLVLGASVIGPMIVAEAAASRVKVVLTGEGSDEILGGYSWYSTMRLLEPVFRLPQPLRRLVAGMPAVRRRWPGAAGTIAGPRRLNFERYSRSISHLRAQGAATRVLAPAILDELRRSGGIEDAPAPPAAFATWHPFTQMQYFDLKHRMPDVVVQSLDRATMAHSVEARVPFLDHELVEFCARIPPRSKMKWLREKHILRRAMSDILPPDIAWRKKFAMQMPTRAWLRADLPAFAEELLSEPALREAGYFNPQEVAV